MLFYNFKFIFPFLIIWFQVIKASDKPDADYMFRKLEEELVGFNYKHYWNKLSESKGHEEEDVDLRLHKLKECSEGKTWEALFRQTEHEKKKKILELGHNKERLLNLLLWSNTSKLNTKITIYTIIVLFMATLEIKRKKLKWSS